MLNKKLFIFFCFFVFGYILNSHADEYSKRTIQINGNGEVSAQPDVGYITISVQTSSKIATNAVTQNAERTRNVINKIKQIISGNDKVKTTNYNLSPIYDYDKNTKKQFLKEYRVVNEVLVETHDLDNIGMLIDSTTKLGANRVYGPTFDLSNKDILRKKALSLAVKDAKETAKIIAEASGVKIINILKIVPSYNYPKPYRRGAYEVSSSISADSVPTPIESGDIKVKANVNIIFEIQ
ncbi:MAG: DUF541 domain-containing protein [Candidatus Dadabacteria bacterium]|nr:DUF541 domain-containing protein [Candidatus Dadabacteria bacterium]NIQ14370.1 DUF541 domain-containing protein [Candidatus Dadabacteria bacterium]